MDILEVLEEKVEAPEEGFVTAKSQGQCIKEAKILVRNSIESLEVFNYA